MAEGAYVDFRNLHTNDDDLAAHRDNLGRLTDFIATHSAGNAVVVMGDTNTTRHTRSGDTIGDRFGGPHGDYYNDIDRGPAGDHTTSIAPRAGSRVDQMSLTPSNGTTLAHGGTVSPTPGSGEYVTTVHLHQGVRDSHTRIFYAKSTTNLGRTPTGGTTTSDRVTRTAPTGRQITGFHGRADDEADKIGFVYTQR